mmetsp:Transcript_35128/g.54565  ORF Transcript_35128/g.54565 Transcript_35128/m.54565 type:complete len:280 (+) Transcript_35128:175-1014(+)
MLLHKAICNFFASVCCPDLQSLNATIIQCKLSLDQYCGSLLFFCGTRFIVSCIKGCWNHWRCDSFLLHLRLRRNVDWIQLLRRLASFLNRTIRHIYAAGWRARGGLLLGGNFLCERFTLRCTGVASITFISFLSFARRFLRNSFLGLSHLPFLQFLLNIRLEVEPCPLSSLPEGGSHRADRSLNILDYLPNLLPCILWRAVLLGHWFFDFSDMLTYHHRSVSRLQFLPHAVCELQWPLIKLRLDCITSTDVQLLQLFHHHINGFLQFCVFRLKRFIFVL